MFNNGFLDRNSATINNESQAKFPMTHSINDLTSTSILRKPPPSSSHDDAMSDDGSGDSNYLGVPTVLYPLTSTLKTATGSYKKIPTLGSPGDTREYLSKASKSIEQAGTRDYWSASNKSMEHADTREHLSNNPKFNELEDTRVDLTKGTVFMEHADSREFWSKDPKSMKQEVHETDQKSTSLSTTSKTTTSSQMSFSTKEKRLMKKKTRKWKIRDKRRKSLSDTSAKPDAVMLASSSYLPDTRSRLSSDYQSPNISSPTPYSSTKRPISLKRYNVTVSPRKRVTGSGNNSLPENRVLFKTPDTRTVNFDPGSSVCFNDPCGIEVSCHPTTTGFICICTDGTEVSPGEKCPIIKPVNFTPPAIPIDEARQAPPTTLSVWVLSVLFVALFVVVATLSVIWWKKNKFYSLIVKLKKKGVHYEGEDSLTKGNPLNLMTFANNPNYIPSPGNNNSPTHLSSLSSHLISKDQIHIIGDLGEGCFGKVFKAEYGPKTHGLEEARPRSMSTVSNCSTVDSWAKRIVAVKVLKKPNGPEGQTDFLREANIVSKFEHPNILSLIGIVLTENLVPWMVFEFMPYGDLTEVLRSYDDFISYSAPKKNVNLTDLIEILRDIASGMDYLSKQHYVHRDLACRNCLVGENLVVKISDFGMCRDVYTSDYYTVNGCPMVPVRWMPPESILYGKFTFESDVWSFGVVAWEVFAFAKQPYYGFTNEQAVKFILDECLLTPTPICPRQVVELMKSCWKKQPHHRPSFEDILCHLQTAKDIAILNNGEFPKGGDDVHYTLLSTSTDKIPVDGDEYLLPSPTHQREYLSFVTSLLEQNVTA